MLTDITIKQAIHEPRGPKARKLPDERGLYLLLTPTGSALWRFRYTFAGKENLIGLGPYPDVPLKRAREKREEARRQVADGINPSGERQRVKRERANTFSQIADEYLARQSKKLAPKTIAKARGHLRNWLNSSLGNRPISTINAPDVLQAIRKIEVTGKTETAHKAKELCGRVFMYGIATGRCTRNVAADLKLALEPRVGAHYPFIKNPVMVGELLHAIDCYSAQPATCAALKLLPHVFLRQGEFRPGRWEEIDWKAKVWRIPASRMKGHRGDHLVPLSRQAMAILQDLKGWTEYSGFLFPAIGPRKRPISENTLGTALRALGYSNDVMVPHGFRHMASTLMHELGWLSSDIELQLAHTDGNKIRGIYNAAERIKPRTKLMQKWSDYLDTLRGEGKPVTNGTANPLVASAMHLSHSGCGPTS